jgi:hypothetical protein
VTGLRAFREATTHCDTWPMSVFALSDRVGKMFETVILSFGGLGSLCSGYLLGGDVRWVRELKRAISVELGSRLSHPTYCVSGESPFPARSMSDQESIARALADAAVVDVSRIYARDAYSVKASVREFDEIVGELCGDPLEVEPNVLFV